MLYYLIIISEIFFLNILNYFYCRAVMELRGHTAELSNCIWNFDCSLIATSSLDSSARVWDIRKSFNCIHSITGHRNEVLDVCFDYAGKRLATASTDCTAKVWDVIGALNLEAVMSGHTDEVSKVSIFVNFWLYAKDVKLYLSIYFQRHQFLHD